MITMAYYTDEVIDTGPDALPTLIERVLGRVREQRQGRAILGHSVSHAYRPAVPHVRPAAWSVLVIISYEGGADE